MSISTASFLKDEKTELIKVMGCGQSAPKVANPETQKKRALAEAQRFKERKTLERRASSMNLEGSQLRRGNTQPLLKKGMSSKSLGGINRSDPSTATSSSQFRTFREASIEEEGLEVINLPANSSRLQGRADFSDEQARNPSAKRGSLATSPVSNNERRNAWGVEDQRSTEQQQRSKTYHKTTTMPVEGRPVQTEQRRGSSGAEVQVALQSQLRELQSRLEKVEAQKTKSQSKQKAQVKQEMMPVLPGAVQDPPRAKSKVTFSKSRATSNYNDDSDEEGHY